MDSIAINSSQNNFCACLISRSSLYISQQGLFSMVLCVCIRSNYITITVPIARLTLPHGRPVCSSRIYVVMDLVETLMLLRRKFQFIFVCTETRCPTLIISVDQCIQDNSWDTQPSQHTLILHSKFLFCWFLSWKEHIHHKISLLYAFHLHHKEFLLHLNKYLSPHIKRKR